MRYTTEGFLFFRAAFLNVCKLISIFKKVLNQLLAVPVIPYEHNTTFQFHKILKKQGFCLAYMSCKSFSFKHTSPFMLVLLVTLEYFKRKESNLCSIDISFGSLKYFLKIRGTKKDHVCWQRSTINLKTRNLTDLEILRSRKGISVTLNFTILVSLFLKTLSM